MNVAKVSIALSLAMIAGIAAVRCAKSGGSSYDFTSTAKASIALKSRTVKRGNRVDGPTLCSSVVCVTPTKLTGRYYGTGFLIQAGGQGMVAYFGQDAWSGITGTSDSFAFDSATPVTNSGNLTCCGGTGDLASSNTYVEDAIYLFGYLDATFTLSGITSNTNMNREFTVRFVLADGAVTDGKRGDLLMKDADTTFKWMDTSVSAGGDVGAGTLTATRPTSPVTMNSSITSYTNPFGADKGNQSIPVIYAPLVPESGDGVFTISDTQLKTAGRTYTYAFDPANFVMFPQILTADLNTLSTYTAMLQKIHLGGLPHSAQSNGVGNPASTVLTVTEPTAR